MLGTGLVLLAAAFFGAGDATPRVAVSIEPLAFFVERIGGPDVRVDVLVGPGQSPHTYEPAPRHLAAVSSSDIFFGVAMPFEQRIVEKISGARGDLKVVDAAAGVRRRCMGGERCSHEHHHGDEEEDDGLDPHVWLSPANAHVMAENVARALQREYPERADFYQANLDVLLDELEALDARLREILGPFQGRTFYVYHPAFGYFADAYGLRQESIEVSGKEPTARQLAEFIERARRDNVRVIFVQSAFPARTAEAVAKAVGGAVIPIDPLSRDYLGNLESVALKMRDAMKDDGVDERAAVVFRGHGQRPRV